MRVLVFLQGTVLMHAAAAGVPRAARVQQVRERDASVRDSAGYLPTEHAVEKLRGWHEQGAEIGYLSAHRAPAEVELDRAVLERHGFPAGPVHCRAPGETYGELVAADPPDVLIEDDCESIGAAEITVWQLPDGLRRRIRSVVVPEFGGLGHLPDALEELGARSRS